MVLNTGILQDRTLDLYREHEKMMLHYKERDMQMREQRKEAFVKAMSVDTVNTFSDKAQQKQLEMIKEFNEKWVQRSKEYPNFNLPAGEMIEMQKERRAIDQFQQTQTRTLEAVRNVQKAVANDYNGRWDEDETTFNINEQREKYDGTQLLTEDMLMVKSYVNIASHMKKSVGAYQADTYERQDWNAKEGRYETRKVISRATDETDAMTKTVAILENDKELSRAANYFLNKLQREDAPVGALDKLTARAKQIETTFGGVDGMTRDKAIKIAALELGGGAQIMDYFDEVRVGEKEVKPTQGRRTATEEYGYQASGVRHDIMGEDEEMAAIPKESTVNFLKRPFKANVVNARMEFPNGKRAQGTGQSEVFVTSVSKNKAYGFIRQPAMEVDLGIYGTIRLDGNMSESSARTAYNASGVKFDVLEKRDVLDASGNPTGKTEWVPVSQKERSVSVIIPLEKDIEQDVLISNMRGIFPTIVDDIRKLPSDKKAPKKDTKAPTATQIVGKLKTPKGEFDWATVEADKADKNMAPMAFYAKYGISKSQAVKPK